MTKRPFPKHYTFFLELAKSLKLRNPRGRALYMVNRVQNGDITHPFYTIHYPYRGMGHIPKSYFLERWEEKLRSIRQDTADRWLKHWQNDGSIKMISLSRSSFNKRKAKEEKERRDRQ